jgi:hypothetical protein
MGLTIWRGLGKAIRSIAGRRLRGDNAPFGRLQLEVSPPSCAETHPIRFEFEENFTEFGLSRIGAALKVIWEISVETLRTIQRDQSHAICTFLEQTITHDHVPPLSSRSSGRCETVFTVPRIH